MRPGRFFWKLFLGHAVLMTALLVASIRLIAGELDTAHLDDLTRQLRAQADRVAQLVADDFREENADHLRHVTAQAAHFLPEIRVTMISADGQVWADSEADASTMENHRDRAEIRAALAGGFGDAVRFSKTVGREMKYVAVRVGDAARPAGCVRVSTPARGIAAMAATTRHVLWRIGGIGMAAALLLALGLALVWSRPIRRITETARSLSRGDLSARVRESGRDELAEMARSLNQMRDHLAAQLHTIDRQRRNLEYLIRTLQEGVIVVSADGRIMLINPAAVRLLKLMSSGGGARETAVARSESSVAGNGYIGEHVDRCVPHPTLLDLLRSNHSVASHAIRSTTAGDSRDGPARMRAGREVRLECEHPGGVEYWSARVADIELASPERPDGVDPAARLVVLTDITELTRTIQMKADFVANASHELRTPLSAIRASVETLQGLDSAADAESARHFVEVIDRHSARLVELVADLLDLSRLESPLAQFPTETLSLSGFLSELRSRYDAASVANGVRLDVRCDPGIDLVNISPQLLRLVLDNLVDNAVKFTDRGGQVSVACDRVGEALRIEVSDTGCGIPEDQQSRVFERFYQVQRSRSGHGSSRMRGTGLGLSIVRHAVAAMEGTVALWSRVGEGTRVTLSIPHT